MYQVDDYTVSLLHFDDGIKDETGKVWTANGSPIVSSDQSKFGGKSLYLDDSSYLTTPSSADFDFGTEDFTIDWWEYRTDITTLTGMVFQASGYYTLHVGSLVNGNVNCGVSSNGSSWNMFGLISLGAVDLNTWNHFAFVRKGSNFYGFKNGHLISTATSNLAIANKGKPAYIGCCINDSMQVSYNFNGYIDELRISKGIARWIKDFDPTNTEDGKFLLTITLAEEVEREYPVTKDELDAFIKWYDSRANGSGSVYYTFDKFLNRKDYIVYDKILTFEVTDFSK